MALLNDETLKAVGQFAIEFTTLEELVRVLAILMLECEEWDVAEYLGTNSTGGRNLERIKKVIEILSSKYELTDSEPHKALTKQIAAAQDIMNQRNTVIHGELTVEQGKQPVVKAKQKVVELSPAALSELMKKTNFVTDKLLDTHGEFMRAVYEARDAAAKSAKKRT